MMKSLLQHLEINEQKINEKPKIIICNDETKKELLQIRNTIETIENIKIMTLRELRGLLYPNYDDVDIIKTVMRDVSSLEYTKEIISNLKYIEYNKEYKSKRLNEFQKYVKKHDVDSKLKEITSVYQLVVIDTSLTLYEENLILNIEDSIIKKKNFPKKDCIIIKHEDITDEVKHVLEKIAHLINQKIKLEDIKVYLPTSDYEYIFDILAKHYNVPYKRKSVKKLESFKSVMEILSDIENEELDITLEKYNIDDESLFNKIISILDKYQIDENDDITKMIVIDKIKNANYLTKSYKMISQIDIYDDFIFKDKNIFILGFNQNIIPKKFNQNDFFTSDEKKELSLYIPSEVKQRNLYNLENLISSDNKVYLSYSITHLSKVYEESYLIAQNAYKVVNELSVNNISYSETIEKLKYYKEFEKKRRYNIESNFLKNIANDYTRDEYNNKFNGNLKINNDMEISHTQIETFFKCSYRYYLKYILRVNKGEFDTSYQIVGNYFHFILEQFMRNRDVINSNIDLFIDKALKEYLSLEKNEALTESQKYYLKKNTNNLYLLLNAVKTEIEHSKYKDEIIIETEMKKKINEQVTLVGKADLILLNIKNDDMFAQIIDYKTGNIEMNIDLVKYGLHMQNLIYYILLKETYKYEEGEIYLDGMYKQKIKPGKLKPNEDVVQHYKLVGYGKADFETVVLPQKKSKIESLDIDGLCDEVERNINKMIETIDEGVFSINPKVIKEKRSYTSKSCQYCEYFEICNKEKSDFKKLD